MPDGDVACWGLNDKGQAGTPLEESSEDLERLSVSPPRRVAGLHNVQQLTAGFDATCALVQNGDVYCWGSNVMGVLGKDTGDDPHDSGGGEAMPAARRASSASV